MRAGADDDDEVDHDVRLDEEIPGPAAAAEVLRVEVPAAVAPQLTARQRRDIDTWLRKRHGQFGHCSSRRSEEILRRRGTHPMTLSQVKHLKCHA